jgi:hypothetical protein
VLPSLITNRALGHYAKTNKVSTQPVDTNNRRRHPLLLWIKQGDLNVLENLTLASQAPALSAPLPIKCIWKRIIDLASKTTHETGMAASGAAAVRDALPNL